MEYIVIKRNNNLSINNKQFLKKRIKKWENSSNIEEINNKNKKSSEKFSFNKYLNNIQIEKAHDKYSPKNLLYQKKIVNLLPDWRTKNAQKNNMVYYGQRRRIY